MDFVDSDPDLEAGSKKVPVYRVVLEWLAFGAVLFGLMKLVGWLIWGKGILSL